MKKHLNLFLEITALVVLAIGIFFLIPREPKESPTMHPFKSLPWTECKKIHLPDGKLLLDHQTNDVRIFYKNSFYPADSKALQAWLDNFFFLPDQEGFLSDLPSESYGCEKNKGYTFEFEKFSLHVSSGKVHPVDPSRFYVCLDQKKIFVYPSVLRNNLIWNLERFLPKTPLFYTNKGYNHSTSAEQVGNGQDLYHSASGLSGTRKTTPLDSGSASKLSGQGYELTGLNPWLYSIRLSGVVIDFTLQKEGPVISDNRQENYLRDLFNLKLTSQFSPPPQNDCTPFLFLQNKIDNSFSDSPKNPPGQNLKSHSVHSQTQSLFAHEKNLCFLCQEEIVCATDESTSAWIRFQQDSYAKKLIQEPQRFLIPDTLQELFSINTMPLEIRFEILPSLDSSLRSKKLFIQKFLGSKTDKKKTVKGRSTWIEIIQKESNQKIYGVFESETNQFCVQNNDTFGWHMCAKLPD